MDSDDDDFTMLPVKRRGPPASTFHNGLYDDPFDMPVKVRGEPANVPYNDSVMNCIESNGDTDVDQILPAVNQMLPGVKRRGAAPVNYDASTPMFDYGPRKVWNGSSNSPIGVDRISSESPGEFDALPVKRRVVAPINRGLEDDTSSNDISNTDGKMPVGGTDEMPVGGTDEMPVGGTDKTFVNGTSSFEFCDLDAPTKSVTFASGMNDADLSTVNSRSHFAQQQQQQSENDFNFQPVESSDFLEGLDFLEQCGGQADEGMDELQRKSLYVRFDPLCGPRRGRNPLNAKVLHAVPIDENKEPIQNTSIAPSQMTFVCSNASKTISDISSFHDLLSDPIISTQDIKSKQGNTFSPKPDNPFSPKQDNPFSPKQDNPFSTTQDDPFSLTQNNPFGTTQNNEPVMDAPPAAVGLVEPLLYTQSDLDVVIDKTKNNVADEVRALEAHWQKKCENLESKLKEEVAMRELLEQDHREKLNSIRKDNVDMKQVLEQYEKTIVQLTEDSHYDNKSKEEILAEALHAKEQLQEDINSAEQNLFDAYKRIEKLKQTIDTYKSNEELLKVKTNEINSKLQQSEDRYMQLREHATVKIDSANALIAKVRKQQEVDLCGLQAGLKKAESRVRNLELEIQQKNLENKQLSQICDDLIKKVSGE